MGNLTFNRLWQIVLAVIFVLGTLGAGHAAEVQINGYTIDVKGEEPKVPADLEPAGDGRYNKWIVQFTGPIRESDKKQLVELGCRVGDYLPDFAFIVTMDNKTKKKVEELPFVSGLVRYKPAYKVDRKLKDESGAIVLEKGKKIKVSIKLDGKDNQPVVMSEVHRRKGKILDVANDMVRAEIDQADISHFADIEEVLWIEEVSDLKLLNDTSKWTIQTYISGNTRIWDKGLHGEGQVVGIGDTGLDYDMPWFKDPAGTAIGPTHRKVIGYDPTYGDDYDSNFGHGSHVAGSVGGDRTPVDGLSNANGMAPKAKFYIQDITAGESNGVYPPSDLGLMFITTYNGGARLHTNSWGGSSNSYNSMSMSADRFMWEHKDFLALFANGNSGSSTGTVGYPANAKNVVSVGATENGTAAENVAYFSSNGPTADGRIKPTITAPGVAIISADSDGIKNSNNSGTVSYSGTSMATPTAAGAAAVIRQYYMEGFYPGGAVNSANAFTPSSALIKATLMNSAQNMTGGYTDGPIPSTGQGWGRINLSNALTFNGDTKTLAVKDDAAGLATGESWSQAYFVAGDQPLKVTAVWTDYPGTVGAAKSIVNDLDLKVTAPDSVTTYLGNVFSNGESTSGGSADRVNVEEQVLIKTPVKGSYTIMVSGYNIPSGPQPFAVVITGASGVTSRGTINLNKSKYSGSGTVEIKVADLDLNTDSATRQEISLTITTDTEPNGETVLLTETDANSSIFTGAISLRLGTPEANNGYLEVQGNDAVSVIYNDADDGTGNPGSVTAGAVIDITAPAISGVKAVTISDVASTVSWTTDEPADSTVNFGETADKGVYKTAPALVTMHTMTLTGLKEGQTYFYDVASTDEAGNVARDDNSGSNYQFATVKLPPVFTVYSSNKSETYFDNTVIYGTATDASGVKSVSITPTGGAEQACTLRTTDGYYECYVSLVMGVNTFAITATDMLDTPGSKSISVTRLLPPDLVLTAVSPSVANVCPGGSITITNTVCNTGAGDSKAFYVGLYLSADTIINGADTGLVTRYVASLQAGACSTATATVTVPTNMSAGTYYVAGIADYSGMQYESDETNNIFASNQITVDGADLLVSAMTMTPDSLITGQSMTVVTTVKNAGGCSAVAFYNGFYLSSDNVITIADTYLGSVSVTPLAAGAETTVTTSFVTPQVNSGFYYAGLITDSYNYIRETDETNNTASAGPVAITRLYPDLVMASVAGDPVDIITGQTLTVTNTVRNQGMWKADGFSVNFYLSTDSVITSADTYLGSRSVSSLAAGADNTAATVLSMPGINSGTYFVGALADANNSITESDETNNTLAGNQISNTRVYPDLMMTSVIGDPADIVTGQTLTIVNTVRNQGKLNAGGFYVYFFLSTDTLITSADTYLGSRYISSLAAGADNTTASVYTMPGINSGTYYLGAIADATGSIAETYETNNTFTGNQITNTRLSADLVMTSVAGEPADIVTGQTMTVTGIVRNQGKWNAGGFYVYFYLSADNVITTADTYLGARYISSLAIGADSTVTAVVAVPAINSGKYYVGAVADANNSITESDETNNAIAGNQVTNTRLYADLLVTSVTGSPLDIGTGQTLTITNTVRNQGKWSAGGFYVYFYLSTDSNITSSDTYLGYRYISSLAIETDNTAATLLTMPTMNSGTYYVGAIADATSYVPESDETNNMLAGHQISYTRLYPDLLAASVTGEPAEIVTGQTLTISNTVRNQGKLNAGGFYVYLYLSTDNLITSADTRVGSRYISSLAAGSDNTASTAFTMPVMNSGTYYVGAVVDASSSVVESDETNNALAGNQISYTRLYPDLVMTSVTGTPLAIGTGETLTIINTVKNQGKLSAGGFYINLYLSADDMITSSDTYIGQRYVTGLAGGTENTATAVLAMPALTSGNYYIGAIADVNSSIVESDEANNALAGSQITNTRLYPDLTITSLSGEPVDIVSGETLTVTNTVKNLGKLNATGVYVNFYFSTDNVITSADTYIGQRYVSGVSAGADNTAATVIIMPAINSGTYYVGALADPSNTIVESDETNNALAGNQITNTRLHPDLIVAAVAGDPGNVVSGQTITITSTVRNQGKWSAAGSMNVYFYLSTDNVITSSDTNIGYRYISSLAAGADSIAATVITIPAINSGTYYVGAIIDVSNYIKESDETNNALAGNQITNTRLYPDLLVTSVTGSPADVVTGQTLTVTNTVENQGKWSSGGFYVAIRLSPDPEITAQDILLGIRYVSGLQSGGASTAGTVLKIPDNIPGGTYYVGAVADHYNAVGESDETNNALAGNQVAVAAPDLFMSTVSGPAAATFGQYITVSNTVSAASNGGYPVAFYIRLYLSEDNIITADDTYLGMRYVSGLVPGASSSEATEVYVPTLKRGTYYLGAIADVNSSVVESDETNNSLSGNQIFLKH